MNKYIISLSGILVLLGHTVAQQKYWVYPKEYTNDQHALYSHAKSLKINPIVISQWLGAYSAILDDTQVEDLRVHESLHDLQQINQRIKLFKNSGAPALGKALKQIKADTLIALGLSGKGVTIGIIDAGFLDGDLQNSLQSIRENGQVLGYKNYIEQDITYPYAGTKADNDPHGAKVLEFVGGKTESEQFGLAYGANYYLARTDQADKEYHGEEDYWVAALEWMHTQGVRLVNSSLGYSNGFDDASTDYLPENVDGEFSAITRAATIAVKEKGMTIVLSAGNDGHLEFNIISIPADADGVISVGATAYHHWYKYDYSSIGPAHLDAVKPELSCYASGGTSFAAPVITGLIACMKELQPNLSNHTIIDVLQKSAHLYPYPNNYLGYGVPNAHKILTLLSDSVAVDHTSKLLSVSSDTVSIAMNRNNNIIAFHKKDDYIVIDQEKLRWRDDSVSVYRHEDATFTTVATDEYVWEIQWTDY